MEEDVFWSSAEWDWNVDDEPSCNESIKEEKYFCKISMQNSERSADINPKCSVYPETTVLESNGVTRTNVDRTTQNWCEINLENDETEGVEMTELHASGEPFSLASSNEVMSISSSFPKNTASSNSEVEVNTPSSSLAYQLGMMVMSKAAKVVHDVADSGDGRKVHKELEDVEKMREKLERANARRDELSLELENAQQWISYHEGLQENLNQQLSDATERFVSRQKESELKLQASHMEAERLCADLKATVSQNNELVDKNESNQRTIVELQEQVMTLTQRLADSEQTKSPVRNSHVMQSSQTASPEVVENSTQCSLVLSEGNEKQLTDTRAALETANARCDKMRHRLMSSLESMKAQTSQMRTSRVALEEALNETRDTKEKLKDEKVKVCLAESQLEEAKRTECMLRTQMDQMTQKASLQEKNIQDISHNLESIQLKEQERMVQIRATLLVQNCIREAKEEVANSRRDEELQEVLSRCRKLASNLKEQRFFEDHLREELEESQTLNAEKEEHLHEIKTKMQILSEEQIRSKEENIRGKEQIKSLKITSEQRDRALDDSKKEFENLIQLRSQELDGLKRIITNLENENSRLRKSLEERELESGISSKEHERQNKYLRDRISEFEQQLLQSNKENHDLKSENKAVRQENKVLLCRVEEMKSDVEENKRTKDELSKAEQKHSELLAVTEEDRQVISGYEHAIHNLREDCRGLDWICRDQHRRIAELSWENRAIREHLRQSVPRTEEVDQQCSEDPPPPGKLDTIVETEERESVSKTPSSNTPNSVVVSSVLEEEEEEEEEEESVGKSQVDGSRTSIEGVSTSSPCSSKSKSLKRFKLRNKPTAKHRAHHQLSMWRRERSSTPQVNHVTRSQVAGINGAESSDDNVFHPAEEPRERRLGIPMAEEQFNEILSNEAPSGITHKDFDRVNQSHDDGYASSICLTPHRTQRRSRRPRSTTRETANHYYVTYDGVTFDLASFSMAKMRQITSTCASTNTPEGMDAFFEFLAARANELNSDLKWRGRHTLGEAADWLELRGVYR